MPVQRYVSDESAQPGELEPTFRELGFSYDMIPGANIPRVFYKNGVAGYVCKNSTDGLFMQVSTPDEPTDEQSNSVTNLLLRLPMLRELGSREE